MRRLLIIIIFSSLLFEIHSDEQQQLKQIELSKIVSKKDLWQKINNTLLSHIQSKSDYITEIDYDGYESIYELNRGRAEKVFILIYKIGPLGYSYYLIIAIYDESNQDTRVVNILDVKGQQRYEMMELPDFLKDGNVPILRD